MDREQLTAIVSSRGRSPRSARTGSAIGDSVRAVLAARTKGRSTQGRTVEAIFGQAETRSIDSLKPGAKPRG
jgi:hypothetical protein